MLTSCLESIVQQQVNTFKQPKVNRRIRKVVKKKRVNNNINVNQSHIPFINVNPLVNTNPLDNPNPLANSNPFVINPVNNMVNPNLNLNTFNNSAL
jgi:hypothetical protein